MLHGGNFMQHGQASTAEKLLLRAPAALNRARPVPFIYMGYSGRKMSYDYNLAVHWTLGPRGVFRENINQ